MRSFALMGSSSNKGLFALIAQKEFTNAKQLKGKRIAVGALGDAPYNYTVALLKNFGIGNRDVTWVQVGTRRQRTGGGAAGEPRRRHAADCAELLPARRSGLQEPGEPRDYPVFAATTYLFSKSAITANPRLPEQIIKAHAEAIKRFYDDKAFAVKTYIAYDKQPEADVARIYDLYAKGNIFDRVPYVMEPAVKAIINQQVDPRLAKDLKSFDFKKVIDNSVVSRLVKEGYFQQLFGAGIKAEEDRRGRDAFR
jgi:ABC-type nitrate/sulfonate/bicarbonate transport system substrate-binding protein